MVFEYNETIINNIDINIFNKNSFYFLPKEYEWQYIITRRLENNLISDKYTYKYTDNISFKSSVYSKLKIIDINFSYDSKEFNDLQIHYEIDYYNIVKNNEMNVNSYKNKKEEKQKLRKEDNNKNIIESDKNIIESEQNIEENYSDDNSEINIDLLTVESCFDEQIIN
jgi:hypothetical protein